MKKLIFLIDGTWANSEADPPSNVVRLAQRVARTDALGQKQVIFYHRGVGTGYGTGVLARGIDRYMGGALGWGAAVIVEECYRQLVFNYEPGDQIFFFGWSRGAHIARRLADVIRSVGLLDADNVRSVRTSVFREISRHTDHRTQPWSPESFKYRAKVSPRYATSIAELHWREAHGLEKPILLTLDYIGLWDCVSAVTLPVGRRKGGRRRSGMQAHDSNVSRFVQSARHAVAIDERSKMYQPELFENFQALDASDGIMDGTFQQKWFPGDHRHLGGKSERDDLVRPPFDFVVAGAEAAGLTLLPDLRPEPWIEPGPIPSMLRQKVFAADRAGPQSAAEIAAFTHRFMEANPDYRPAILKRVLADGAGP